jgi:hypothetical protein
LYITTELLEEVPNVPWNIGSLEFLEIEDSKFHITTELLMDVINVPWNIGSLEFLEHQGPNCTQ